MYREEENRKTNLFSHEHAYIPYNIALFEDL